LEVNTQHAAAPACEKNAQLAQPSPFARHETHGNDSICETTTRPRPRRSSRPRFEAPLSGRPESNRADRGRRIDRGDRIRAVTSTDAAANGLDTTTELRGKRAQAEIPHRTGG